MYFLRQVLKFAAANFILQDGIACLNHITTIYSAFAGDIVSDVTSTVLVRELAAHYESQNAMQFCASCSILWTQTHHFRFLSVLVGISDSGNQIFTRVLLSELIVVEHASATYACTLTNLDCLCGYLVVYVANPLICF
jgi:hypothetical protein